jgi:hypothetical protein
MGAEESKMTYEQAIRAVGHVESRLGAWSRKAPALIQDEIESLRSVLRSLERSLRGGLVQHEPERPERHEDIDNNEPGDLSPEDERLAEGLRR